MHIQRPEVRIIEPQQEISQPAEVSNSEAAALLAKYGFSQNQIDVSPNQPNCDPTSNMTVQEFFELQQREIEAERVRKQRLMYGPKAATFDSNNIKYSETNYKTIDDTNFGIQIQIVSDMPINNNSRR